MATANAPELPATHREGLLARHPLIFYFIMAYAGTWLVTDDSPEQRLIHPIS